MPQQSRQEKEKSKTDRVLAQQAQTDRVLAQQAQKRADKMRKKTRASRSFGLETDINYWEMDMEIAAEMEEQKFWEMEFLWVMESVAEIPALYHTVQLGGETPPHTSDNVTDKFEMIYSAGTTVGGSFHGSGYFMVRCRGDNSSQVYVGSYDHCSCFGVDDAIGKRLSSPPDERWVWTGNVHDFMRDIVYKGMDLQMPERPVDPLDYNYGDITTFYEAAREWYTLHYDTTDDVARAA